MCGAFKAESPATETIQALVNNFKTDIESQLAAVFSVFRAQTFSTQLVSGTNYKVKIEVDGGQVIEVKIYEPLPHTGNPKQLSSCSYV